MAAAVVLGEVPFGVLLLERLIFRRELRLLDCEEQDGDGDEHDGRDDDEQRLVVDVVQPGRLRIGIEDRGHAEIEDAADCAHQVDDGVRARAQGLGRDVGHEGDRRGAIGAHGDEQQTQHDDERGRLQPGGLGGVAVVEQGEDVHEDDGAARAEEDERHALADLRMAPVRQRAEERQQEQREDVVRRHDRAGEGLVHVEGLGEDQRHDAVIHLPERADGQKREADEDGALIVELHFSSPFCKVLRTSRIFCMQ